MTQELNIKTPITGFLGALASFVVWGLSPLYWGLLGKVSSLEVLCFRITGTFIFVSLFLKIIYKWKAAISDLRSLKIIAAVMLSTVLVASNWLIYVWAVNSGHVVDASMGYFITPLLSVALGVFILKEKLTKLQAAAVLCALAGVVYAGWSHGSIPWVALSLAFTFSLYGFMRKISTLGSLQGLAAETALLFPLAAGYILFLAGTGQSGFINLGWGIRGILAGACVITALPLIWFVHGVRNLNLSTVGFLQYIAPTLQFLTGILFFKEIFSSSDLFSFIFIWIGVIFYMISMWFQRNQKNTDQAL